MSNTFQWTLESTIDFFEFAYERPHESFSNNLAAFVASKEPKKEWEIVAYRHIHLSKLDMGNCVIRKDSKHWPDGPNDDYEIWSVLRLSDGEVFSVGDRTNNGFIRGFKIGVSENGVKDNNQMYVTCVATVGDEVPCAGLSLRFIKKVPAPLFTTLDGKDIISGDVFWVVNKETQLSERLAGISSPNYIFDGDKVFSTREAAETYILENRALLSIKDLRELLIHCVGLDLTNEIVGFATNLVKSKLNP